VIDPQTYDWTTFEIVFYYDRPVGEVFRAWASAEGLESFFVEHAHFTSSDGANRGPAEIVRTGDAYEWTWRHGHAITGRVTEVVEDREVSFTFGGMHVSVLFAVVAGRTEVRLRQSEIPATPEGRVLGHLNCRSCWIFFMTNLRSVLGAQHDLRDEDPDTVSSMEVGFSPRSRKM
jgi:uncharacterized protein YndB with AHSA1/START domain